MPEIVSGFLRGVSRQLFLSCNDPPPVSVVAVDRICQAMDAVSACLVCNRLLLNTSKTQFIWLGGGWRLASTGVLG